ncbi:TPA: hypothetical protein RI785_002575 [Vibrio cholerae]|uniref:Uncharacterized protein n=1 Tax=Vibrio cholerae TaxID=666 RepID=A0A5Q6PE46_VIBCL|nr:hypothetical protein [Vibrio cholerae]KAA1253162.1 hypothetical protein F0M16_19190 [Vibrio cholerae]HDV5593855.1 hypothetical protein [Vibrio cholerae]
MNFNLSDLDKDHAIVKAGRLMQYLYHQHENAYESCAKVLEAFPELKPDQVMCLWVGVNIAENAECRESIELIKP